MLHHEEADPVLVSDVVEGADVGVVELRERRRLPLEALPPLGAFSEVLSQNLDGDRSLEPSVAGLVDLPHSTSSNESEDLVRAQAVTGAERHRRASPSR